MTIRKNKVPRAIAILALPESVPSFMDRARVIVTSMTANPDLPVPTPPVAIVQQAIDDLQAAQVGALLHTTGAAAFRNAKQARVVTLLEEWCTQVQTAADENPEIAAPIIQSSGMMLRKIPPLPRRLFTAKHGPVSGSVNLVAPASADRAAYKWQYSVDDGKTWITLPQTLQAKTSVAGLPPLTTVLFRFRPATKVGEGDWSQPVSLVVL
jgi:hypothetical protein